MLCGVGVNVARALLNAAHLSMALLDVSLMPPAGTKTFFFISHLPVFSFEASALTSGAVY